MISPDLLAIYPNWLEHFKKLEKYAYEDIVNFLTADTWSIKAYNEWIPEEYTSFFTWSKNNNYAYRIVFANHTIECFGISRYVFEIHQIFQLSNYRGDYGIFGPLEFFLPNNKKFLSYRDYKEYEKLLSL